jgi:hypothetical protein
MSDRAKGWLTAFVSVVGAALFLVWLVVDGSTTWPRTIRCRRIVIVDTPEGQRSGSSVIEDKTHFPGGLTRAQGYAVTGEGQGEATVVDLGARGLLFATLASEEGIKSGGRGNLSGAGCYAPFPREKFPGKFERGGSPTDEYVAYLDELNRQQPKGDVPLKYLPILVRFRDLSDPTSVELVDPSDLAASFGAGVKLERMSIEITDAPVTRGIEAVLPWLGNRGSQYIIPPTFGPVAHLPLVKLLTYNDFRSSPQ